MGCCATIGIASAACSSVSSACCASTIAPRLGQPVLRRWRRPAWPTTSLDGRFDIAGQDQVARPLRSGRQRLARLGRRTGAARTASTVPRAAIRAHAHFWIVACQARRDRIEFGGEAGGRDAVLSLAARMRARACGWLCAEQLRRGAGRYRRAARPPPRRTARGHRDQHRLGAGGVGYRLQDLRRGLRAASTGLTGGACHRSVGLRHSGAWRRRGARHFGPQGRQPGWRQPADRQAATDKRQYRQCDACSPVQILFPLRPVMRPTALSSARRRRQQGLVVGAVGDGHRRASRGLPPRRWLWKRRRA
jgi:hypothetical protein